MQVAILLRSVSRGYLPDKSFVIVSFIATAVLLVGWRSALAAATPAPPAEGAGKVPLTPIQRARARKDKKGNPLEFLQLLTSLVKRW